MTMKLKAYIEQKEGEIVGVASTDTPDRDGEVIRQDGWDLRNFKGNPVILMSHNYQDFPIGKATDIRIDGNRLIFTAVFSKTLQKAIDAYQLVKEGILNCFSVGFIPRSYDPADSNIITKAELLEISLVPVPANPEAVVLAKEYKENDVAKFLVKMFQEEEVVKEEVKEEEETEPVSDTTAEVIAESEDKENGEDSGEVEAKEIDFDLKLIQKATGYLQEVCRELKKKGGATK